MTSLHVVATAPSGNAPARKYCFKASAHLKSTGGRVLASFTAYDKSPEVAAAVQRTCEAVRAQQQHLPSGVQCSVVELLMYDLCPTECDGEVSTVFH